MFTLQSIMNKKSILSIIFMIIAYHFLSHPILSHANDKDDFEKDYFGLPTVNINFLNPKAVKDICIDAKIYPWSWVDGRFALIQNELTPMGISLANPKNIKNPNPALIFELPEGVELVGSIHGMPAPKIVSKDNGYNIWSTKIPSGYLSLTRKHESAHMRVALYTNLKPVKSGLKAYYYYKDDKVRQPRQSIELMVLPQLLQLNKPQYFQLGASLHMNDACFENPALNQWVELCSKAGLSLITFPTDMSVTEPGADRDIGGYYQAFSKKGFKVFLDSFKFGSHGNDIGYWQCRPLPKEAQAAKIDGTLSKTYASLHWMINSSEFREKLHDYLFDFAVKNKRCDSFAINWEPLSWKDMDFSDGTLKDLAYFLNQDPADINKLGRIKFIEKNRAHLISFRNRQFGELIKVIREVLNEIEYKTGLKLDMLPYVNSNLEEDYNNYPGDIGKYCRIIAPFGYPGTHYFLKTYRGFTTRFTKAFPSYVKRIRKHRQWAKDQDPQSPPLLYHMADFDVVATISLPAQLRLEALLDLFYGYKGIFFYRFRGGYDGRYYHSFSRICNDIVKLEPYFFGSDKELSIEKGGISIEGYPGKSILDLDEGEWQSNFIDADLLFNGKQRIAYIANLQERWEAIAKIQFNNLPEGKYAIYDPIKETQLEVAGSKKISSKILRKGFYSTLYPNEILFWVIEPWKGLVKFRKSFSPDANAEKFEFVKSNYIKNKKIEEERKKEKELNIKKPFKLKVAEQKKGPFRVYSKNNYLLVEGPGQKIEFDIAHGSQIRSWTVNGMEMVLRTGLMRDRLWEEKKGILKKGFINSIYKIKDINITEKSLFIDFECKYPHENLLFKKRVSLYDDHKGKIDVSVTVANLGEQIITFAYWLENFPKVMDRNENKKDDCRWFLPTENGLFENESCFTQVFYKVDNIPHQDFVKLAPFKSSFLQQTVSGDNTLLYSPSLKKGMKMVFKPQTTAFFYSWDGLGSSLRTCDVIFRHVNLLPNESWSTDFSYEAILGDEHFDAILKKIKE